VLLSSSVPDWRPGRLSICARSIDDEGRHGPRLTIFIGHAINNVNNNVDVIVVDSKAEMARSTLPISPEPAAMGMQGE